MVSRLRRSIALRWAAVIAWMGLIFFLSSRSDLPNFAPGLPGFEEIGGHLTAYGVLAGLLWWALRGSGVKYPATWALVLAVFYGVTDEFHQSFVPGRDHVTQRPDGGSDRRERGAVDRHPAARRGRMGLRAD